MQPTLSKRRRRFPERQLLDRLHLYEDLLRQNNVAFTPLHSSSVAAAAAPTDDEDDYTPSPRSNNDKETM